jgi:hypothetical protein
VTAPSEWPPKAEPALSVVMVTRDHGRTLRPIIGALRAQTVADRIEVVIVAPRRAAAIASGSDAVGFHSVQVVEVGSVTNRGRAAAAGVLAAKGSVVALTENHCFPTPHWGERLLASHAEGRVAVGPAVGNANPESRLSQTMHAFGYGLFPRSAPAGPVEEMPLHNSSFRREILPRDLETLGDLLADERRLHRALRQRGHILWFDPRVVKWHINEATWPLLGALSYDSGRRYGGTRSAEWPVWRRALYTVTAPALSVPIARNLWVKLSPDGEIRRDLSLAAVVWVCALIHALGEGASYLRGAREDFPAVEDDEFLIRERLGGRPLTRPEVASLVALLDDPVDGAT